jgi:uncharacterized protein (TIGR00266 family)
MYVDIGCSPSYSIAYIYLSSGETVLVESGAMAYMSGGIEVSIGIGSGGVIGAASRKMLGGESFFMGAYTSNVDGAWVAVAPKFPGDIAHETMNHDSLVVESGALLAVSKSLDVDVKFSGVSNILLREGATLLRVTGSGDLLLGAYGGLQRFELGAGEHLIVDTGHLVGYSADMKVKVGPLSSVTTSVVVGEGLVGFLQGPGVVYTQTRSEQSMKSWLFPDRGQNERR